MKLPAGFPAVGTLRGLASWIQTLAQSIASGWNVEHRENGRHKFPWVDVLPSVSGDSTMTWTGRTITLYRYRVIDDSMTIAFDVSATVGGTPTDALLIDLPAGYTASLPYGVGTFAYTDAAPASGTGVVFALGQKLWLYQNITGVPWTAGAARVAGTLTFKVEKS